MAVVAKIARDSMVIKSIIQRQQDKAWTEKASRSMNTRTTRPIVVHRATMVLTLMSRQLPKNRRTRPPRPVSYTHLRAHETDSYLVCRLLLEKKKKNHKNKT